MGNSFLAFALAAMLAFAGCAGSPIKEGMDSQGRAWRGADSPKLTIYEYSDFECPFCGRVQPTVEQVLRAYPDSVRLEYRHNPLVGIHPRSMASAIAAVCSEEQGKFWQMHDRLFASQAALEDADLKRYAGEIGLDAEKFNSCIASSAAAARVNADAAEAASAGVSGTPTFRIGETLVRGAQPFSVFKSAVDSELARAG